MLEHLGARSCPGSFRNSKRVISMPLTLPEL